MEQATSINEQARGLLQFLADSFNSDPEMQQQLQGRNGWIDATVGLRSDDGLLEQALVFDKGKISLKAPVPENADVQLVFTTGEDLMTQLMGSADDAVMSILRGRLRIEGNLAYAQLFNYVLSLLMGEEMEKSIEAQKQEHRKANLELGRDADRSGREERSRRKQSRIRGSAGDPGVKVLGDPFLSDFGLEALPRLEALREQLFAAPCELSPEMGELMTDFFVQNGSYETRKDGTPWEPNLRRAESLRYVLENRLPVIRDRSLLAGSYTPNPVNGCVGHPFAVLPFLWGELKTCRTRELQPYAVSDQCIESLHKYVIPYWARRNFTEWWKQRYDNPLAAQIHERFFSIFFWKTVSMSEVTAGFDKIVRKGTRGLREEIDRELAGPGEQDAEKRNLLQAMKIALQGVNVYAARLAAQAEQQSRTESDPARRAELETLREVLRRVPEHPARTLYEAVQSIAIALVCLGMESVDDGPALGRLDQILQPYFEADALAITDPERREHYVRQAVELTGCLYFLVSSHDIPAPEVGIWQNSGSSPNITITVGGVNQKGEDAVNDMTYIILKVTELLALNNPNMHARFQPGVNSLDYLRRVCDVNYITGATPAIHGDPAMIEALGSHGWKLEDVRDWVATGCVEPSLPGVHSSATSSLEINLVAPLEMALNDGLHPLMNWQLGPRTGRVDRGDFADFEQFMQAFTAQCEFLFEQAVVGNDQLGLLYQEHQPAPLLSSLTDDCIKSGRGITRGGARYNSSGATFMGLADVVDSLLVIKQLVFEEKRISFPELKQAMETNFEGSQGLQALVRNRVRRFGSRDPEALQMARRVTGLVNGFFRARVNYRGGHYATGWWSMSNHVSYGRVTGATPSGRLDAEPFTPGLTPHPGASANLLDNLMDVAMLDPKTLDNNIAFNVRVVPGPDDTHEQAVDRMTAYAKTFIEKGGMQVQFNVVDTDTLRDAMAHPELYRDLMVRISGYCAYFTELVRDLQLEVIRRCEYQM